MRSNAIVNHYHKVSGSLVSSSHFSSLYSPPTPPTPPPTLPTPPTPPSPIHSPTLPTPPIPPTPPSSCCSSWVHICQHETGIDCHHHLVLHLTEQLH